MNKYIKNIISLVLSFSFLFSTVFSVKASEDDFIYQGLDSLKYEIDFTRLDKFKNVHPRILTDENRFNNVISLINKNERMKNVHKSVKDMADFATVPDKITGDGNNFARKIQALTFMYKETKDKKYLGILSELIDKVCSIKKWENFPDLATGKILTALGICYDWLYNDLPVDLKKTMKTKMLFECENAYNYVSNPINPVRTWLQNHTWIICHGMGIAGFALFEENENCYKYIRRATRHFITTASLLPKDGFNHEGADYFFYGTESLFMYNEVLKDLLDIDLTNIPFYDNVTDFIIYSFLPEESFSNNKFYFEYNDSSGNPNILPYLLSYIAKIKKDPYAQWFSNMFIDLKIYGSNPFLYLLWNDNNIVAKEPYNKNTMKHFSDADFLFSRSSWNNNETIVSFAAGPPMGHFENEKTKKMDAVTNWGAGHVHPHCNHFLLYGNKELLLCDDNYAIPKLTRNHNTLIINNIGQLGEGENWFNHKEYHSEQGDSKIIKALSDADYDYIVGDGTKAYKKSLGLKKYNRHLLFLKPDILIVIDDIELQNEAEGELRFFPDTDNIIKQSDGSFLSEFKNTKLKITPLTENITTAVKEEELNTRYYNKIRKFISLSKRGSSWLNVTLISLADKTSDFKNISYKKEGENFIFSYGNNSYKISPKNLSLTKNNKSDIAFMLDNEFITFKNPPIDMNNDCYVPIYEFTDKIKGNIIEKSSSFIDFIFNNKLIRIKANDKNIKVGENNIIFNNSPVIKDNILYVPLKELSPYLDGPCSYNNVNKVAIYNTKEREIEKPLLSVKVNEGGTVSQKVFADPKGPLQIKIKPENNYYIKKVLLNNKVMGNYKAKEETILNFKGEPGTLEIIFEKYNNGECDLLLSDDLYIESSGVILFGRLIKNNTLVRENGILYSEDNINFKKLKFNGELDINNYFGFFLKGKKEGKFYIIPYATDNYGKEFKGELHIFTI